MALLIELHYHFSFNVRLILGGDVGCSVKKPHQMLLL